MIVQLAHDSQSSWIINGGAAGRIAYSDSLFYNMLVLVTSNGSIGSYVEPSALIFGLSI